uniref:Uncharacterized protein n=1 Tax=Sphaerodactylus townsendi TaxID=933632 RepID=A0ACB8GDM7_9SAUR
METQRRVQCKMPQRKVLHQRYVQKKLPQEVDIQGTLQQRSGWLQVLLTTTAAFKLERSQRSGFISPDAKVATNDVQSAAAAEE